MPSTAANLTFLSPTANKGVSANLLQAGSKRRRTQQQIADEKEEAEREKLHIQAKLAQYDAL